MVCSIGGEASSVRSDVRGAKLKINSSRKRIQSSKTNEVCILNIPISDGIRQANVLSFLFMKTAKDLRIPFTWAERRPILLDRFFYLPKSYDGHERWGVFDWADPQVFGNQQPVIIEYCSGNGQWIGERAKQNPTVNWVAVE